MISRKVTAGLLARPAGYIGSLAGRTRTLATVPQSYYSLFPSSLSQGPPPSGPFKLDLGSLKREFLQLQAKSHPDKLGSLDPDHPDRKHLELFSSQLNVAYKALINPLLRAQHVLQLRGIDALSERDSLHDEDLLMDVLMAREAIAEATSLEDVADLKADNDKRIAEAEEALQAAFAHDDLDAAKTETIKLSYWESLRQQINKQDE